MRYAGGSERPGNLGQSVPGGLAARPNPQRERLDERRALPHPGQGSPTPGQETPRQIATRVDPYTGFFHAEDHHQDYLVRHPIAPYIAIYDMPKLSHLRAQFPALWREQPVLAL